MVVVVEKLSHQKAIEGLEARVNCLLEEADELKGNVKWKEMETRSAMRKVNKSIKVIQKIQDYIGNPGDVVNKAKLFNNNLAKAEPRW